MIKDASILEKFEDDLCKKEGPLPYSKTLEIFEQMWEETVALKVFPTKNPLEGIEVDIRMAKILNTCLKNSYQK